jgi:NDP-sugar pyrophosphorylase family protein
MKNHNHKNLIIPMVGIGSKFVKAGYETYKSFNEISGETLLSYAIKPFPKDFTKYVIIGKNNLSDADQKRLLEIDNVRVITIDSHTNGPGYSIYMARDHLPQNESFFITYCDIFWTWNYADVEALLDYDGIVFTRKSFSPHLIDNNFSAFCLPSKEQPLKLQQLREKGHFTDKWMDEPLSVGTFYVKNGADMFEALRTMINDNERVNNEFYPSMIFNYLIQSGKEIRMHDVDFFIHWGEPNSYEDVKQWIQIDKLESNKEIVSHSHQNICCMGGLGERMKSQSNKPKALIDTEGLPMYQHVLSKFACAQNTIITVDHLIPQIKNQTSPVQYDVYGVGEQTSSQIETLQRAIDFLTTQKNFYLTSCDAYGYYDEVKFDKYIQVNDPDIILFAFQPTWLQRRCKMNHTYMTTEGSRVKAIHVKNKMNETDKGLAGFFWFKDGAVFEALDSFQFNQERECIVDDYLKYLLEGKIKVHCYDLDYYVHLGSVYEYQEYLFWKQYGRVFK